MVSIIYCTLKNYFRFRRHTIRDITYYLFIIFSTVQNSDPGNKGNLAIASDKPESVKNIVLL